MTFNNFRLSYAMSKLSNVCQFQFTSFFDHFFHQLSIPFVTNEELMFLTQTMLCYVFFLCVFYGFQNVSIEVISFLASIFFVLCFIVYRTVVCDEQNKKGKNEWMKEWMRRKEQQKINSIFCMSVWWLNSTFAFTLCEMNKQK